MDLINLSTEWAKAEVFSTRFFMLFAILFFTASIGFWLFGKTDLAKAYVIPNLTAGLLIMTIGIGLFYTNKNRIKSFEIDFNNNPAVFIINETNRIEHTLKEYKNVFIIIPIIIMIAALLIILIDKPLRQASYTTLIAVMIVILIIDGNAYERIKVYNKKINLIEIK